MGTEVSFRFNAGAATTHSMFDGDDELAEGYGHVHFSAFTLGRQKKIYGIDYADCITYGPEGAETEMVGAPDSDDEVGGWYTPDWDRAVLRVETLLAACLATTSEHRRTYDEDRLREYRELILKCASHPQREHCQVRIHD